MSTTIDVEAFIHTLQCAVENMRSADTGERLVEARFRIAFNIEAAIPQLREALRPGQQEPLAWITQKAFSDWTDRQEKIECRAVFFLWRDSEPGGMPRVAIYAAPFAPNANGWRPTHRHKERGGEYMLLGIGRMQTDWWWDLRQIPGKTPADMREVAVYRAQNGTLWVRPREEFEDGRFEALRTGGADGR